jgi:hypothetical protein
MFELSNKTKDASEGVQKNPAIVVTFDGVDGFFGSAEILSLVRIGDPGLVIGGEWVIGGSRPDADNFNSISFQNTSTSIKQQLDIEKGRGSGISNMEIGFVDFDQRITRLISPGVEIADIMGTKASVFLSPDGSKTNYPEDYVRIFRGLVDEVKSGPGLIKINIAHPDQKKRQTIYTKASAKTTAAISASQTTIPLDSATQFLTKVLSPSGTYDQSFESHVRIKDEIIYYDSIVSNVLQGCIRGRLGTVAVAHPAAEQVDTVYRLKGNVLDLALKVMASGKEFFIEDISPENFNRDLTLNLIPSSIYFLKNNVEENYGLMVGDFVSSSGAMNAANNFSKKRIESITKTQDGGSYITLEGVSTVDEPSTSAILKFTSQYSTLPDGLEMGSDEIDISQHLFVQRTFLSSFELDFHLGDSIENAKEWLDLEVYKPAGAYSIPRAAKSSVAYFIGPVPGIDIKTLSKENITNPSAITVNRSTNKNFSNTVIYKFDKDLISDKFLKGIVYQSASSLSRIDIGTKAQVIEASGIRSTLNGENITQAAADRKLKRFRFGSETIPGLKIKFGEGFNMELADIVILDSDDLKILDSKAGGRSKPIGLYEVNNISKDPKNGSIVVDLIDTNFDGTKRYGLISPSSRIKQAASTTEFTIEPPWVSRFGSSEFKKWDRYRQPAIKITSPDYTTRFGQSKIVSNIGNTFIVNPPLPFIPEAGDTMNLADYDYPQTDQIKLIYIFVRDTSFADSKIQYSML